MTGAVSSWLSDPYVWAGIGLAFMLAELVIPGFLMLGFGLAALGMALLTALGVGAALEPLIQIFIWAAAAIGAWYALSRAFGRKSRRAGRRDVNDFRNH